MLRLCILQLTLLLICLVPDAAAQAPADLEEAMRLRSQAVVNSDASTWDKYTADDFTVVLADGTMMNKSERLAQIRTQKPTDFTPRAGPGQALWRDLRPPVLGQQRLGDGGLD